MERGGSGGFAALVAAMMAWRRGGKYRDALNRRVDDGWRRRGLHDGGLGMLVPGVPLVPRVVLATQE